MAGSRTLTIDQLRTRIAAIERGDEAWSEPLVPSSTEARQTSRASALQPAAHDEESVRAFTRIESLFSFRDRSEDEMRKRLAAEEFGAESIDSAIAKAKRCGLIDDARFADALIRARLHSGKGVCGIERDLRSRGVEPTSLRDWPEEYEGTSVADQRQRALELLSKRPPRSKNPLRSAYERLVRKGYAPSVASDAAREWFATNFR